MTREEAKMTIYEIINSGIIDTELEEELTEIANCICEDNFDKCEGSEYCEGCSFRQKY